MGSYRLRDLETGDILGTLDTDDEKAAQTWATELGAPSRHEYALELLTGADWAQRLRAGRVKKHGHPPTE